MLGFRLQRLLQCSMGQAGSDVHALSQISYTQRDGEAREPEGEGAAMVQQLARPRAQGVDAFLAASQIQLFRRGPQSGPSLLTSRVLQYLQQQSLRRCRAALEDRRWHACWAFCMYQEQHQTCESAAAEHERQATCFEGAKSCPPHHLHCLNQRAYLDHRWHAGCRDGQQLDATDAARGTANALQALEAASSSSEGEEDASRQQDSDTEGDGMLPACMSVLAVCAELPGAAQHHSVRMCGCCWIAGPVGSTAMDAMQLAWIRAAGRAPQQALRDEASHPKRRNICPSSHAPMFWCFGMAAAPMATYPASPAICKVL